MGNKIKSPKTVKSFTLRCISLIRRFFFFQNMSASGFNFISLKQLKWAHLFWNRHEKPPSLHKILKRWKKEVGLSDDDDDVAQCLKFPPNNQTHLFFSFFKFSFAQPNYFQSLSIPLKWRFSSPNMRRFMPDGPHGGAVVTYLTSQSGWSLHILPVHVCFYSSILKRSKNRLIGDCKTAGMRLLWWIDHLSGLCPTVTHQSAEIDGRIPVIVFWDELWPLVTPAPVPQLRELVLFCRTDSAQATPLRWEIFSAVLMRVLAALSVNFSLDDSFSGVSLSAHRPAANSEAIAPFILCFS